MLLFQEVSQKHWIFIMSILEDNNNTDAPSFKHSDSITIVIVTLRIPKVLTTV